MMKTIICPTCRAETQGQLKAKKETYPVKGESIEIQAEVLVCAKCGEEVFDEKHDRENLEAAYTIYRKNHGLMAPSEITSIRKKYGLGQRALARLLSWGEITLHRYEAGAIQDAAHDEVLRFIDEPLNMRRLFEQNYEALSPAMRESFAKRLNQLIESEIGPAFRASLEQVIGHREIDIISGFKAFDLGKFENMVLYFARNFEAVLKTKMNKLLWYTDFLNFSENAVSMSGSKYLHLQYGPVPEEYALIIGNMEHEHQIIIKEHIFDLEKGVVGEEISALIDPDHSVFDHEDRRIMDFLIGKFRKFGSGDIARYSHKEKAFKATADGEYISYNYATELSISLPEK